MLLHDLPAGALSSITDAVDVTGQSAMALVDAARQMGYATTVVIAVNTDTASARAVGNTINAFGDKAQYVIVKNLNGLNPSLARHIRDSASRAGLQAHDPAARMIAEMWVAVDALKQERNLLSSEVVGLTQRMRQNHLYLLALTAIGTVNLLLVPCRASCRQPTA